MNLYDATVPVFTKVLVHAHKWLDKAAAHADARKFDAEILLHAWLAPDQWPLARQFRAVCEGSMFGVATLAGKTSPGLTGDDKSIAGIHHHLTTAVDYLGTFKREDLADGDRPCTHPSMGGKSLSAVDFLNHLILPNFHFHATTAYAILRHHGVDVGKMDYLVSLPFKA